MSCEKDGFGRFLPFYMIFVIWHLEKKRPERADDASVSSLYVLLYTKAISKILFLFYLSVCVVSIVSA